jgi:hypothetical protein
LVLAVQSSPVYVKTSSRALPSQRSEPGETTVGMQQVFSTSQLAAALYVASLRAAVAGVHVPVVAPFAGVDVAVATVWELADQRAAVAIRVVPVIALFAGVELAVTAVGQLTDRRAALP